MLNGKVILYVGGLLLICTSIFVVMFYTSLLLICTSIFVVVMYCTSLFNRRLAMADQNEELTKTARLAQVFKNIFAIVASYKGQSQPGAVTFAFHSSGGRISQTVLFKKFVFYFCQQKPIF